MMVVLSVIEVGFRTGCWAWFSGLGDLLLWVEMSIRNYHDGLDCL